MVCSITTIKYLFTPTLHMENGPHLLNVLHMVHFKICFAFFLLLFGLIWFGAVPSNAQGLLTALNSGITSGGV